MIENVENVDKRRSKLREKLMDVNDRIRRFEDQIRQLQADISVANKERDKIQDDLRCHVRIKQLESVFKYPYARCELEIGHKTGHKFHLQGDDYVIVGADDSDDSGKKEVVKESDD